MRYPQYDGDRSPLGDCCQNHDPMTAPVVYPHRVTAEPDDNLHGEYQCACGRHWSCWWGMSGAGWTLADVRRYGGSSCPRCVPAEIPEGEWFHRGPCHGCRSCGGNGCYVWNDNVTPEVHICESGCDGMPPGLRQAS